MAAPGPTSPGTVSVITSTSPPLLHGRQAAAGRYARLRSAAAAVLALPALGACEARPPQIEAETIGVTEVESTVAACTGSAPPVVDTIAAGLEVPWDIAFLPDGRALVTERPGRIRVIPAQGRLEAEPWAELPVHAPAGSEVGLMGIDLGPGGEHAYVVATVARPSSHLLRRIRDRLLRSLGPDRGQPITLTVYRIPVRGAGPRDVEPVVRGVASGYLHGGGALRFGPDGLLYVSNGDALDHWWAQSPASSRGKILRWTRDGSVPESNPTPGSPVYAKGIRHVQGIAWHPAARHPLVIDHGPSGLESEDFRTDDDELSVASPGANLGWPIVTGASQGGGLTSPLAVWTPALAPAGLAIYRGGHAVWDGSVFVTGLRGASLRRLAMAWDDEDRPQVLCEETLLPDAFGRLRAIRQAPDGSLWVGTSNRDGRGIPRLGDDLILRIRPPA